MRILTTIIILLLSTFTHTRPYITYEFSGGRLGDNLVSYVNAKWLAYKQGLTLLYRPFPYADQLRLSQLEQPISSVKQDLIQRVPYFSECVKTVPGAPPPANPPILFRPDWTDQNFLSEIRTAIAPIHPTKSIALPKDRVSIALHLRTGSGNDRMTHDNGPHVPGVSYSDTILPGNHPPESYYITCVQSVIAMYPPETNFYIYIFTDNKDPKALMSHYQRVLNLPNATFDCAQGTARHKNNVLDDLFAMTQFQCLVMPASNLSFIASKLGYFSYVLQPGSISMVHGKAVIDHIKWTVHQTQEYLLAIGVTPACHV